MTDFSQFEQFEQSVDARPYRFDMLEINGKVPVVYFRPATSANPDFYGESLKRVAARQKSGAKVGEVDMARVNLTRDEDRELFANFCAVKWEDVDGSDGKASKFSKENCHKFLKAVPDWAFDQLRAWIITPQNFVKGMAADGTTLGN